MTTRRTILSAALAAPFALATPAHAADPIRIIANYPPGASLDSLARAYAEGLRATTGVLAIVDNKAGANGNIGAANVAQAAGDGKTLLISPDAVVTANPALYKTLGFDLARLSPIGMLSFQPSVLVVKSGSPLHTVSDFVKEAKKAKLTYSSAGAGSGGHLTMGYFISVADLDQKMTHIPYKGGSPAMVALMAGEVDSAFVALGNALPLVKQGKLTALAVSGQQRSPQLPDVPTIIESGFPGFVVVAGNLVMAPSNSSKAVKDELGKQLEDVVKGEQFKRTLTMLGMESAQMDAAQTATWIGTERSRWEKLISDHGITPD